MTNSNDDTVSPINTKNDHVGRRSRSAAGPDADAITPGGRTLYVGNFDDDRVTPVDIATRTAGTPIDVGSGPVAIAITPDGKTTYTTNAGDGSVAPIDLTSNAAEPDITLGQRAFAVAITPRRQDRLRRRLRKRRRDTDRHRNQHRPNDDRRRRWRRSGRHHPRRQDRLHRQLQRRQRDADRHRDELRGHPFPVGASPQWVAIEPGQGPTAAFSAQPAPAGSPTTLDAAASGDPDGTVHKYRWDFGDGAAETTTSPTTTHTYDTPRRKRVTLRVVDNEACSTDFVYTGATASCNGSSAAAKVRDHVKIPFHRGRPQGRLALSRRRQRAGRRRRCSSPRR